MLHPKDELLNPAEIGDGLTRKLFDFIETRNAKMHSGTEDQ
jgi:hypothetical protein